MPFSTGLFMADEDKFEFTAIVSDSESENEDSHDQISTLRKDSFLVPPSTRRFSNISRRGSVRSKISINGAAKDTSDIPFIEDYSSDLSQRTIHDFKEINILGIGAYGRVFLVEDVYTKKLYAKKTIKKAKISVDSKIYKTHKNEKEILAQMNHPSIVKLFYSFHDHEDINFILEYIPGGEIFFYLSKQNRFDETTTAFYIAEIAQAIYHLHSVAGIVYRDLKPENVLLNAQGHIVLTDFGLSSLDEVCNSILGTPEFTAPEVLKGEEYSYPADWWSLGIVMYDLLTGDPPFTGKNKDLIFKRIIQNKLDIPYYLSEDAKDLLRKLINKNPAKRMKIDQDFKILQKHRFFRKISNWDTLRDQDPPIIPDVSNPRDATNVDHKWIKNYLEKEARQRKPSTGPTEFDNDLFQGFSFVASKGYLDTHM